MTAAGCRKAVGVAKIAAIRHQDALCERRTSPCHSRSAVMQLEKTLFEVPLILATPEELCIEGAAIDEPNQRGRFALRNSSTAAWA